MFKNVIIGVDANGGGLDAIKLAQRLVEPEGALTLVNVYPADTHPWRGSAPAYEAVEREDSLRLLERLRWETGREAGVQSVGAVTPGQGLHLAADATGADLLVVGSPHDGLVGRVLVRTDTKAAMNGASCAVAIAPAGYARALDVMREIGVGYDGSPESENAVEAARELSDQVGAKLSAFTAVCPPTYLFSSGYVGVVEDGVDGMVDSARERAAALGVEPHAAYGHPAEELAVYSASLDLLVVGSRGYGPLGRLIHGSTSRQLARTARCPLLVLSRSGRPEGRSSGDSNKARAGVLAA